MNQRFPKMSRLRTSEEFQRVFAAKNTAADDTLVLFALPNGLPHHRLGLSVSRKAGNAVVRNRWKRLLREAFRTSPPLLPASYDFVAVPKKGVNIRHIKTLAPVLECLAAKIESRRESEKKTVLLIRSDRQNEAVQLELEKIGFQVLRQPVIDILPPDSWDETDAAIAKILREEYDWLVFSSTNGVRFFFDRCGSKSLPPSLAIAAVGSGTASALLETIGRHADLIPPIFTAEHAAAALLAKTESGSRILHVRADRGRETLRQILTEAGRAVTEIAVYQSADRQSIEPAIAEQMEQGKIDYVFVTSSAIAASLVNLFGTALQKTCLISISPLTSQTLTALGYPPQFEAAEASMPGLIRTLPNE